ncbi:MAG: amino acid permease [Spirochaetota bacterium]|nr:MAG: amino acid permease [Spirochaetota bacterium]
MMGLGMMIGAGVFIGVGNAIHIAGPGGVLLTFSLNGVIALFTAMSYAELSSAIPHAGGAYNFARIGFGRGTSFLAGWMEWFASSVAGSVYALTFAIYTLRYFEKLGLITWLPIPIPMAVKILAGIIACFFIYINYRGVSETGKIGAFFTMGQCLFLIVIGVIGVYVALREPVRLSNFTPFLPNGWSRLFITMGFTFVAFEGFEVIAQAGDETINPRQNLPKAMLISVFIVTLIYVLVAFATVISVRAGSPGIEGEPWQWIGNFKERGFGEAVSRLLPFGNILLTLAVIFASTSALNATIYSATRVSYALGRDRMLPPYFAAISRKRKTPKTALIFTGIVIISIAIFFPTLDVAASASIMFLFLFFLVNLSVIKIRRDIGDELTYGYVMPLFPVFPILAILLQATLALWLVNMSLIAWIVAPSWIFAGVIIYHLYSKAHTKTSEHEITVIEEEKAPEGDEYRIMVACANPASALGLVRNTYKLCGAKKARVELLHMVSVPEQVSLSDAHLYMLDGKEAMIEVMLYLAPIFPVSTTIRYCRSIARGILTAVNEKNIEMLIMGYGIKRKTHTFRLGSTLDPVIERAACDIVIFKEPKNEIYRNILVPVSGGPNSFFAMEVASILMEKKGGKITLFNVDSGKGRFDVARFAEEHYRSLHIPLESITWKSVQSHNVAEAIIEESATYDLVVIGITNLPRMYRAVKLTIPEVIASACPTPLVLVKAQGGMMSKIKRLI